MITGLERDIIGTKCMLGAFFIGMVSWMGIDRLYYGRKAHEVYLEAQEIMVSSSEVQRYVDLEGKISAIQDLEERINVAQPSQIKYYDLTCEELINQREEIVEKYNNLIEMRGELKNLEFLTDVQEYKSTLEESTKINSQFHFYVLPFGMVPPILVSLIWMGIVKKQENSKKEEDYVNNISNDEDDSLVLFSKNNSISFRERLKWAYQNGVKYKQARRDTEKELEFRKGYSTPSQMAFSRYALYASLRTIEKGNKYKSIFESVAYNIGKFDIDDFLRF